MDLAFAHDKYQLIVPILSSLVKESPLKESKVVLANYCQSDLLLIISSKQYSNVHHRCLCKDIMVLHNWYQLPH